MNVIDIIIVVILAISLLLGLYRGFLQSLLNLAGGVISFIASFALYPKLSSALSTNSALTKIISNYTGSANLLGSLDLSNMKIDALTEADISTIVQKANLPSPLDQILKSNLAQKVFAPLGNAATTVGEYINQTIVTTSINVVSFLICFLLSFLLITIIINLIRKVFKLPMLHLLDSLAGGVVGLALGALVCIALFTLVPLMKSVLPVEGFDELLAESKLAAWFQKDGLIISIMNKKLL